VTEGKGVWGETWPEFPMWSKRRKLPSTLVKGKDCPSREGPGEG